MTRYSAPGTTGSVVTFADRYEHFIGGEFVAPAKGEYFENESPVNGVVFTEAARGTADDIERALDAAEAAATTWGRTSPSERAGVLLKIADRMEANLEKLAVAESWDNGKPVRETLAADLPLAIDHLRYFAGAIRAQEGGLSQIDDDTVAYHFHEPFGVVGLIIPWNFPLLLAMWKLAPALAAGNTVVLKPAEQTPASIHVLLELIADVVPAGVINVVTGFGLEAGKPLASSSRAIMQYASQNLIPVTLELGGKSPNIFFADVADANDDFYDRTLEGFTMFALNQGETCTCPSRALIQADIYDDADAIKIANDSLYGLAGGVWTRNGTVAYRASRDIQAGRIFVNDYHNYPAHAAFGGYKQSGIGRENHKMMLEHYQQTKCVLTSYATTAKGFF